MNVRKANPSMMLSFCIVIFCRDFARNAQKNLLKTYHCDATKCEGLDQQQLLVAGN